MSLVRSPSVFAFVFSKRSYFVIASASAIGLWFIFNVLDGLILVSPGLTFYYPIPEDAIAGLVLSSITAALAGLVISLNIFLLKAGSRVGKVSFFSGPGLGMISSMCVSCSSVGFYLASTFGLAGVAASSFLSNYQTLFRIVAIGLLLVALFAAWRKIGRTCKIST
jgi:hypothetical protein